MLFRSDLVFPGPGSNGVALTAAGGTAGLVVLTVTPLADAMNGAYPG